MTYLELEELWMASIQGGRLGSILGEEQVAVEVNEQDELVQLLVELVQLAGHLLTPVLFLYLDSVSLRAPRPLPPDGARVPHRLEFAAT